MKITYLLLSFIFFSSQLNAQIFSHEFQNTSSIDASNYAIQNSASGYLIGLTTVDASNDFRTKFQVISTDLSGSIENVKLYETADSNFSVTCNQIIDLATGKKLVSGVYSPNNNSPFEPFIMLLNVDGSVNWTKKIPVNDSRTPFLKLLSDNTIFVAFKQSDPASHLVFCKLNLNGDFSQIKEVNAEFSGEIVTANTYASSFELLYQTGNLINISNDLSTIHWQRKYHNAIGITYNRTANGDYIYASSQVAFPGYMTIFRTDSIGTFRWAKYIEAWEGPNQTQAAEFDIVGFNFVTEVSNGNIIASANSEGGQNGSLNVTLDANGNYISNHKIETFQNKTVLLDNETYLVAGFSDFATFNTSNFILENRSLNHSFPCDIILSHTIANGTDMSLTPDILTLTAYNFPATNMAMISVTETMLQNDYCNIYIGTNENLELENKITVYPNPTSDLIWVKSDSELVSVSVLNSLGQEIQRTTNSCIDMSTYTNGIYFLEITIENKYSEIKKIIKN